MNMDMHRLLSALLQLLVLIPGAVSCYLPVKKQMKYTPAKTAALCTAVILPYSLATAFLHAAFSISMEALFFPALVLSFSCTAERWTWTFPAPSPFMWGSAP